MKINTIVLGVSEELAEEVIQAVTCEWPSIKITQDIVLAIAAIMSSDPNSDGFACRLDRVGRMISKFRETYKDPKQKDNSGPFWAGSYLIGWENGNPFVRLTAFVGHSVSFGSKYSNVNAWLTINIDFDEGSKEQAEKVLRRLSKFEGMLEYVNIDSDGVQPSGSTHSFEAMLNLLQSSMTEKA